MNLANSNDFSSAFQEMMSAYFSDFAKIDPAVICTWIFELESQLSELNAPKEEEKPIINFELVLHAQRLGIF